MKRFQIFLPEDQIDRLKIVGRGRPLAELIRQAIAEFLSRVDEREVEQRHTQEHTQEHE